MLIYIRNNFLRKYAVLRENGQNVALKRVENATLPFIKGEEMLIAIKVLKTIGTILTVLLAYRSVLFVLGFFSTKKFKPTENKHTYGICIAARNERAVIKNFLQSVESSDYPLDKLTVFIMAHNCTDDTAEVVREYAKSLDKLKVVVYEYNNSDEKTKGFALKKLFENIKEDYTIEALDGYFVFDADNVVSKNYFTKMNEAFDTGNKIVTSFRNSKNANKNWISFGYAMHWIRTSLNTHRGKSLINLACRIQGTGFVFANELVKDGWNYTSFTEDRSFCSDAVVKNYNISYCDEAVFYDEQPYKLKIALRQRIRWAKGHLQSTVENCPKLLRNMFKPKINFFNTYDCFFLNFPTQIESVIRKILIFILKIVIVVTMPPLLVGSGLPAIFNVEQFVCTNFTGYLMAACVVYAVGLVKTWLRSIGNVILIFIKYGNKIEKGNFFKRLFHIFMFPFFDIIGKWSMYIALFKRVEWKPIPHDTVVNVDKL